MKICFEAQLWEWRGPAPFYFISVPEEDVASIKDAALILSYGWGMVPALISVGSGTWSTSLTPRQGGYIVPIKNEIRLGEKLSVGDSVSVVIELGASA